jgi:hypothetical protein
VWRRNRMRRATRVSVWLDWRQEQGRKEGHLQADDLTSSCARACGARRFDRIARCRLQAEGSSAAHVMLFAEGKAGNLAYCHRVLSVTTSVGCSVIRHGSAGKCFVLSARC